MLFKLHRAFSSISINGGLFLYPSVLDKQLFPVGFFIKGTDIISLVPGSANHTPPGWIESPVFQMLLKLFDRLCSDESAESVLFVIIVEPAVCR